MDQTTPTMVEARDGTRATGRRVRVGLLVGLAELVPWQRCIVQRILADPCVEISLVIEGHPQETDASSPFDRPARMVWDYIDRGEAALARRLFGRALRQKGVAAEKLDNGHVGLHALLNTAKVRTVRLDALAAGSRRLALTAADLDVILALEPGLVYGGLSAMAKYGVWRLSSKGAQIDSKTPLGYWDVYSNDAFTNLHVIAARQGARGDSVIASGSYCTFRWSWSLNALLLGPKSACLVVDALRRLQCSESCATKSLAAPKVQATVVTERGLVHALAAPLKCAGRILGEAIHRALFEERWRVLLVEGTPEPRSSTAPIVIEPPIGSYWADPFAVRWNGKCYVFCEEYIYAERRGVISCVEIGDLGNLSGSPRFRSRRVLEAPYHLSYPFLLQRESTLYMIPESSSNGTIDLWRCVEFPGVWCKHKTIMDGVSAADTTLLQWNSKWWLFTNIDRSGVGDHCSELHVFHSDDPIEGQWRPHALNPVIVDARRARMAGGFLKAKDGRPVRCCQVQGRRYGERVAYNVVEELTETRYVERSIGDFIHVASAPRAKHHHIAENDGLVVADECLDSSKLSRVFRHSFWSP